MDKIIKRQLLARILSTFIFFLLLSTNSYAAQHIRTELKSGSHAREYYTYVPANYETKKPVPLLLVFHGGGGNALQIARFTGFDTIAELQGFLVVYPEAIDSHWNDGRNGEKFREHDAKINDVQFVRDLLTTVQRNYIIDQTRIYATGISNGGIFCQRLAIEMSNTFAAIASLTAQIAKPLEISKPQSPISILIINGTTDPFVPYNGGEVTPVIFPKLSKLRKEPNRGKVISTEATINFWIKHNAITTEKRVEQLPNRFRNDGATIERTSWLDEANNKSIVLYKVVGGGHTWPGGRQYLPRRIIGNTCRDINATEEIWKFFSKHKKSKQRSNSLIQLRQN